MKVLVLPPPLLGPLLELLLLQGILPPGLRASRRLLVPVDRRRLVPVDRRRLIPVDRRPPLAVRRPKRATLLSATNTTMNTRSSPRVRWRP